MQVAEVFVNIPVKSIAKAFTYIVPADLDVGVGWRVFVPFGGRKVEGFILSLREEKVVQGQSYTLKEIISAVDEEAWFTPEMIKAAQWLADFYLYKPSKIQFPYYQIFSILIPYLTQVHRALKWFHLRHYYSNYSGIWLLPEAST